MTLKQGDSTPFVHRFGRRSLFKSLVVAAALAVGLIGCNDDGNSQAFYASWTAPQQNYNEVLPIAPAPAPAPAAQSFADQTLRQVVRSSLGGEAVRVKLSNLFGSAPVTFSGVRVARSTGGPAIDVASGTAVQFGGQAVVTVAAGAEVLSDPVPLAVSP